MDPIGITEEIIYAPKEMFLGLRYNHLHRSSIEGLAGLPQEITIMAASRGAH